MRVLLLSFCLLWAIAFSTVAQSNRAWTPWTPCSSNEDSPLSQVYFSKRVALFVEYNGMTYWEVKFKLEGEKVKSIQFVPGIEVPYSEGHIRTYYLEKLTLSLANPEGLVKEFVKHQEGTAQDIKVVVLQSGSE